MQAPARTPYTDYLALEARSEIKHEFIDGFVRAMAGGTIEHARLAASCTRILGNALADRPCVVFSSDARVHIDASNRSTYPDLSIVCGPLERSSIDREAIANPVVIVEVLSETTEAYDRGEKFRHYRRLTSLREYVLVSQREPLVEVWHREGDAWRPTEHGPGQLAPLVSLDVASDVDALYANALADHG